MLDSQGEYASIGNPAAVPSPRREEALRSRPADSHLSWSAGGKPHVAEIGKADDEDQEKSDRHQGSPSVIKLWRPYRWAPGWFWS